MTDSRYDQTAAGEQPADIYDPSELAARQQQEAERAQAEKVAATNTAAGDTDSSGDDDVQRSEPGDGPDTGSVTGDREANAPRDNDDRTQPLGAPSAPDGDEHPLGPDRGATDLTRDELGGGHQ